MHGGVINCDFRPVSRFISEWNANRKPYPRFRIVPFWMTLNDLEWLSEIFNDTRHRASLQQLNFLLFAVWMSVVRSPAGPVVNSSADTRRRHSLSVAHNNMPLKHCKWKQVRQQDAYTTNAGVQIKTMCNIVAPCFRLTCCRLLQVALLLQRGRAVLCVRQYS